MVVGLLARSLGSRDSCDDPWLRLEKLGVHASTSAAGNFVLLRFA
jgi:hypothetical protein